MKNIFNIMSIVVAFCVSSVVFTSCNNDDDKPKSSINILSSSTFFPVEGGEKEVVLQQMVDSAYAQDAWLSVKKDGTKLLLQATLNTYATSRSTLLVLKNNDGTFLNISVTQEGIFYGIPQDQEILSNNNAVTKEISVGSNIPMNYSSTAEWIKVQYIDGILKIETTSNTTGEARVGWVTAEIDRSNLPGGLEANKHIEIKTDSLRVVQASIDNFVGEYTQHATTLDSLQQIIPIVSVVKIEKINATKARFIVDSVYTWEIDFQNGVGFTLTNGKIVKTSRDRRGNTLYSLSVIVADDYSNGHQTAINGVNDKLFLRINNQGKLEFVDGIRASKEQLFRGYGWNNYSVRVPEQSALQGVEKVYIKPTLIKNN